MAGNKTNSNSITAILVNKLNYRKSGFRGAILKSWGLSDDIEFKDGTHSSINFPEMEGKQVDIVGMVGSDYKVLIEVKANLNEPLQDSQKEYGQYQKSAKKYNIDLKYIVPNGYYHQSDIPQDSSQISWSEIYEIAKEYDNTGFIKDIEYFVETDFHKNTLDSVLNKGEAVMFLSPNILSKVDSLVFKIEKMLLGFQSDEIVIRTELKKQERLGLWCSISYKNKTEDIWIGLYGLDEFPNQALFIYQWIGNNQISKYCFDKFIERTDYSLSKYETGSDLWFPISYENNEFPEFIFSDNFDIQQKKFNKIVEDSLKRFFKLFE